jgi:hypothetical protein
MNATIILSLVMIAACVGVVLFEFHYLIDIAHAPNWAVFSFFMLSLGGAGAAAGSRS